MYIIYWFLLSAVVTAIDLYAVMHPSYLGKVLPGNIVSRILLFGGSRNEYPPQSYLDRSMMESKCRWRCFLLENLQCKTFQTYWTIDGSFYCELLSTTLCSACSVMTNQGPDQLESRIWEVKYASTDRNPTVPCVEYPDWKVKGNCSECNKIGYYGRNCSLRSSCASYYYDPGAVQESPNASKSSLRTIAPCFTGGVDMATSCRAQYTRWLFTTGQADKNRWWNENQTFPRSQYLGQLPYQMNLASQLLSSRSRTILLRLDTGSPPVSYMLYSHFSVGSNGSLTLGENLSPELVDGLNVPIASAPLLKAMNDTCGPMWLVNRSVPYNQTHIDSCAAPSSVFSLPVKWAGKNYYTVGLFVDIDYFECPDN